MARTNNPQIFLNRLNLGQVSDFVTDLLPPGCHFNLLNKDHFNSPSITMKQLTKMKNARGEQHPDDLFSKDGWSVELQKKHHKRPPTHHPSATLRVDGTAWSTSVQDRFNQFCVSKTINILKIQSHHIILRFILARSGRRLPLLAAKKHHEQGQFTFFLLIVTYTYISI
ncbi:unnamed protein product [Adineta steineri]|uniref:Uncharacterized protein n=1 Tax=Adineta steineri TaxID=433720 RepID=A0A815YA56_9BILA|nr:unnamed protein product [Adineta steineri]CAF1567558.1 unnamed protein product [Adineta steineri]